MNEILQAADGTPQAPLQAADGIHITQASLQAADGTS